MYNIPRKRGIEMNEMLLIYAKFTRPGPMVEAWNQRPMQHIASMLRGLLLPLSGFNSEAQLEISILAFNNSFVLPAPRSFRHNRHKRTLLQPHPQPAAMKPNLVPPLLMAGTPLASAASSAGTPTSNALWITLLPTLRPTTRDYVMCATENMDGTLKVPRPTSAVLKAIQSHAGKIRSESCTLTGAYELDCPPLDGPQLCGITSALPASASAGFSAYGSAASSWVAANSGEMLRMARECPVHWYEAVHYYDQGRWLNDTIKIAECYEVLKVTGLAGGGVVATTTGVGSPGPTPGSGATTIRPPVQTPASINNAARGIMGEAEKAGIWAVIGGGVAVVAAGARRH